MYHRLFVVVGLLSSSIGGSPAHGQPEQVLAFVGGDVILPCSFNISDNNNFPTVEWSKEGLKPNVVFLYRDGCETYEMKNPAFDYRTSLIMKELKDGNISLRISNVQVSDAGKYQCLVFPKNAGRKITTVELVVVAVSEPKLSVISTEGCDVALLCKANCWLPEPPITFLDDKGNNIAAENPKREQDARGCFTVTQRVTLQSATSSVTCRVHQREFNQTRETKILIPAVCMKSDIQTIAIAIGGTTLFFSVAAGLIALLCKKWSKFAIVKQPVTRESSDQSITCESHLLQTSINGMDSLVNGDTGKLKRKSEFRMEDETLCQLHSNKVTRHGRPTIVRSYSTSTPDVPKPFKPLLTQGPDTSNLTSVHNPKPFSSSTSSNTPKSGNLPQSGGLNLVAKRQNSSPAPDHPSQRKHRISSSPDIFQLHSAPSSSSSADSSHLMIDSGASPHRSIHPLQRRHSSVLPQLADKRYRLLRNLTEDDDDEDA